ncbi:MAG: polysaccharide biosynthesis C-terminal domain-containing protein, partial [Chromatiales bacterium]|nr:polysaccharide biosynthesis C-terminal domain-containing protein [Chromatiales bacterium]
DGSISWLYYSDRLMEFPLGVLGVALGTVILPNLSKKHANDAPETFSHTIDWGLRWMLLLGLPAAVGLFMLSGPMIATLFQSNVFDAEDVAMAQRSLMAYSLGLLSFITIKVLAPGYYARQDTKTPVRYAVIAMVTNMVLNIILVFPLAHAGLALATTLSASLNAYLFYKGLREVGIYRPESGWMKQIVQALLAAAVMGALLFWGGAELQNWLEMTREERIWRLVGLIIAGAASYFAVLYAVGIRPYHFRSREA